MKRLGSISRTPTTMTASSTVFQRRMVCVFCTEWSLFLLVVFLIIILWVLGLNLYEVECNDNVY